MCTILQTQHVLQLTTPVSETILIWFNFRLNALKKLSNFQIQSQPRKKTVLPTDSKEYHQIEII